MSEARLKRVTLAEVGRYANVDKSVVSRVLNSDPSLVIKPETRQRVEEAIRILKYRPNITARNLRTARTGTLGMVIPDFSNPVYAEIISGAASAAMESEMVLVTGSAQEARTLAEYFELLGNGRVDGLLIAGGIPSEAERATLARLDLPWLLVNRRDYGSHRYIILDDAHAAELAVHHLVSLGHSDLAHIAGPTNTDTTDRRLKGFTKTAEDLDVNSISIEHSEFSMAGGREALRKLMDPRSRRKPTAIYCAGVTVAVGALYALSELGMRVPQDVSVIATHDSELAAHTMPPLTTVKMPLHQLGSTAVKLLLTKDRGDLIDVTLKEGMAIIHRGSTGAV